MRLKWELKCEMQVGWFQEQLNPRFGTTMWFLLLQTEFFDESNGWLQNMQWTSISRLSPIHLCNSFVISVIIFKSRKTFLWNQFHGWELILSLVHDPSCAYFFKLKRKTAQRMKRLSCVPHVILFITKASSCSKQ